MNQIQKLKRKILKYMTYKKAFNKSTYEDEVLNDLSMIGDTLKDAKNGLGYRTSTAVTIDDV